MALPPKQDIEYPTSDGKPMAETTLHRKVMTNTIGGLERHYADVSDVWVGGNLLMYYREGDPTEVVAPDVLLAQGVAKWDRDVYLLWEEKPPALIFEITSESTRDEDTNFKKNLYEQLGVAELVLFDPRGEYLELRLQGYCLERGRYQSMSLNSDGSLDLQTVGVTARLEGERLRLMDTATGEKLLWEEELEPAWRAAKERAAGEAAARRIAEERADKAAAARRAAEERALSLAKS